MGKQRQIKVTKENLLQWIKNYHWMVNTVKELRNDMTVGAKTAQYGIEATLPKAAGGVRDPIISEVVRRSKHIKRIKEYEHKITAVQERIDKVHTPREIEVLFWLLEGSSMRWIGQHMGLSATSIGRIKEKIIKQMLD